MNPQGAVLCHKPKSTGQSKCARLLRLLICAACVFRGIVEVVALLGFIQRAFYAAQVNGEASEVKSRRRSKRSLAQPRSSINAHLGAIPSSNIDIASLTEELACSAYAKVFRTGNETAYLD